MLVSGVILLFIQTTSNVINVLFFAFGYMMSAISLCFIFYNLILNLNKRKIENGNKEKNKKEYKEEGEEGESGGY